MWGWASLERLWQDLRYASRLLRNNPQFAVVAIATLAIGMGANTAIFSVMDVVLLRPLPYPDAKRLVRIWQSEPRMGEGHLGAAPPEFVAYRDRTRAFTSVAGYQQDSFDLTNEMATEHIPGCRATASLFPALGTQPLLGRTFSQQEESPAAAKVVVLSHRFWSSHYAQSPHVIGKIICLNEQPYEIVGVMPKEFTFPSTLATPGEPAGPLASALIYQRSTQ